MRLFCVLLCSFITLKAETAAGIKWTAPVGWKTESGARPMRFATYTVSDSAECVVYFFGPGQGGAIDANLERWKNQFHGATAKTGKRSVHGLAVTTIDVSGDYSGMGDAAAKPGYRMLGAIVEGPGGNVFFKFTGPAKTIAQNQPKFDALLESVTK
jgi:hypothetical protein